MHLRLDSPDQSLANIPSQKETPLPGENRSVSLLHSTRYDESLSFRVSRPCVT